MWWVVGYLWWFGVLSNNWFCGGCGGGFFLVVGFFVFVFSDYGMILMGWNGLIFVG